VTIFCSVAGLSVKSGTPTINGLQEFVNADFENFSIICYLAYSVA